MPTPKLSPEQLQVAADAYRQLGLDGYKILGIEPKAFEFRVGRAVKAGLVKRSDRRTLPLLSVASAPEPQPPSSTTDVCLLKDQVRTLRAALSTQERENLTDAYVKREIIGLREDLAEAETPLWLISPAKAATTTGTPTLFASDWHWGEVVYPAQVNGVNEFNLEIAHRRAKRMVETACELLLGHISNPDYPGIVFVLGGDMMSGDIHEELSESNEVPVMPALIDLHGVLAEAIDTLAEHFGRVFIPCVSGNHGRNTRKPRAKGRNFSNFDWLLYQFLAKHFENDDRVQFYIPDGSDAHYTVHGHRYCLTHGDQFRGGDGMIGALGPIIRGDHKKRSRNGQIDLGYDTLLLGHWHQLIQLQRLIVNGSLKGMDEYAFQGNFGYEIPQQACWITHPEHGITFSMPIQLEPLLRVGAEREWLSWAA